MRLVDVAASLLAGLGVVGAASGAPAGTAGARPAALPPLVQQGKPLSRSGFFGSAVALSAAGDTALVGTVGHAIRGAAWVFRRSGSSWAQQGPALTQGPKPRAWGFGATVALSGDGNVALVGAPGLSPDTQSPGAAWIFTRAGSTWKQGPQLRGTCVNRVASGDELNFGASVALSADGATGLVAGRCRKLTARSGEDSGAVWVFARNGSRWTQQGEHFNKGGVQPETNTVHDPPGYAEFGSAVALSADGGTALIGGPYDADRRGAAWVFARSASTWAKTAVLRGRTAAKESYLGSGVALSAAGTTAIVGSLDHGVWTFTRSGSRWTERDPAVAADGRPGRALGSPVALSADGATLLVAAAKPAAVLVFTRSASGWTQMQSLTPRGSSSTFGGSIAVSADGGTVLVGGSLDRRHGAVWVFSREGRTS